MGTVLAPARSSFLAVARGWLLLPVAGALALAATRQPTVPAMLQTSGFGIACLTLAHQDLCDRVIPNRILYPALFVVLATSPLRSGGLIDALGGATAGGVPVLVVCLVTGGGVGAGDAKMSALIGSFVGYPMALIALAFGSVLGGIAASCALVLHRSRQTTLPYALFLVTGAAGVLLSR